MRGGTRSATFVGATAVALALALAALVARQPGRLDEASHRWLERRALAIARVVAAESRAALERSDPAEAARALEALAETPEVAYAELIAPDGRALASRGRALPARPAALAGPAAYADGLLHVNVPVAGRAGASGALRLDFTLEALDADQREVRALAALPALAALALGVALTVALALARRVRERTKDLARSNAMLDALRRAQEQLVVADRRVSLGRLAAGVGHEINNPLAFVAANVGWVRDALDALRVRLGVGGASPGEIRAVVDGAREALADAAEGAERVRHIVQQLKTFSRSGDAEQRVPVRPSEAVNVAVEMAAHEIKQRARLVRVDDPAPPVLANPVRLAQVFLNLLVNAAHAIPEGAATRNEIRVRVGAGPAGDAVVTIEDTGTGIAPDVLPRLFQPFFTTKPAAVGTGLGLSISQGIVRDLGGEITVRSEVGKGSTFTVRLPACASGAAVPDEIEPLGTSAPRVRGARRLLVVEDDPLVAAALVRVLSPPDDVEVVTSGRDAIARVEGGARYDRILCDLMMPEASGVDVHDALSRIAPDQAARLVFMSGGAFTERTRAFLETWPGPFLEKPVDLAALRRVLDVA